MLTRYNDGKIHLLPEDLMTQDLRVQKTQATIRHAFWALLATRPLTKITVSDLIAEAGVGKATFYHHYVDKFDLARQLCQACEAPLLQECATRIASQQLKALWAPLPRTVLQNAAHLRLATAIRTPEFNGQMALIQQLAALFQQALDAHDSTCWQASGVALELATLYEHILMVNLLNDPKHPPIVTMAALQQAGTVLFAKA